MRIVAFVALTIVGAMLLLVGWLALIVATGGAFTECDRGDCGTLGELSADLGWLVPIAALAVSAAVAWSLTLRGRRDG